PTAVSTHVVEESGELIADQHHSLWSCHKQRRKTFNGRIARKQPRINKISRIDSFDRHCRWFSPRLGIECGFALHYPFLGGFLCVLAPRFMGKAGLVGAVGSMLLNAIEGAQRDIQTRS